MFVVAKTRKEKQESLFGGHELDSSVIGFSTLSLTVTSEASKSHR